MQALLPVRSDSLGVQRPVDIVDSDRAIGMRLCPRLAEEQEILTATLCAGTVTGRECRRLVQEEEFGEPSRLQEDAAAALEFEPAGDPPLHLPCPDQPAMLVVQHAPVAEQEPPRIGGDDLSGRRDPVASWHGAWMVRPSRDRLIFQCRSDQDEIVR